MTASTRSPRSSGSSGPSPVLVVGAVVVLVAVVAIIAVIVAGGGDDDAGGSSGPTVPTVPVDPDQLDPRIPESIRGEVRPIEIEGTPLPAYAQDPADPAVGTEPPTLVGEDYQGFVHTVSPGIDAPVVLVFLAHWCGACNQEVPMLVDLERDGRIPDDVRIYGVLTGMDPSAPNWTPAQWLDRAGWPFATIVDVPDMDRGATWTAADAFGLTAYPYVVVIDGGVVTDRWTGASPPDAFLARLDAAIS